ncbi:MAG: hypothetical protein HND44_02965 [Chloroflexi bacterium]|nr:hypothetical protein [Ardenticatenaceae bacterium]MBL1127459.1 hypothetical protein [Chloroflexota bacterium]NOG33523.1 hypothetical protein [Chloroflexota bacterium]
MITRPIEVQMMVDIEVKSNGLAVNATSVLVMITSNGTPSYHSQVVIWRWFTTLFNSIQTIAAIFVLETMPGLGQIYQMSLSQQKVVGQARTMNGEQKCVITTSQQGPTIISNIFLETLPAAIMVPEK